MAELGASAGIRELHEADADRMLQIERAAHVVPWSEAVLRESVQGNNECIGIELGSRLLGFAITMKVLDESHLLNLCVDKSLQRQGWGKLLLRAVVDRARKCGCAFVYLEVRVSNQAAITLYRDEGFNEVGIRPNYYPGPRQREDALLMTLDLSVDAYV